MFQNRTVFSLPDDCRLYEGVRTRRFLAFLIDHTIIMLLMVLAFALLNLIAGYLNKTVSLLFLSILLFGIVPGYFWVIHSTCGASFGMRMCKIRLETMDGRPAEGFHAALHSMSSWMTFFSMTPLVLLASLVFDRKRTLHDVTLGLVVVRSDR